jgi:hypothetical protein
MKRYDVRCPNCGGSGVVKARGLQGGGEVLICILLLVCGVIPGLVYYIWKDGKPCCTQCGNRR